MNDKQNLEKIINLSIAMYGLHFGDSPHQWRTDDIDAFKGQVKCFSMQIVMN